MKQYIEQYFSKALQLINSYDGSIPLSHYLKNYFKQHKKFGSKDRKNITHLCFTYYRLGFALSNLEKEERLKAALFLTHSESGNWEKLYNELWISNWKHQLSERIAYLQAIYSQFIIAEIFPFQNISNEIDINALSLSFLQQPKVFLRIRPKKEKQVLLKLQSNEIPYEQISHYCLAINSASKLDEVLQLNKEAVIQDYSSQRISEFFQIVKSQIPKSAISIWDCCAASGGKSILAHDVFENIQLMVSDIRSSIIHNLKQRFAEAGIKNYKSFIADVSHSLSTIDDSQCDLILCDAPCSGSGTWARTPEQLSFFTKEKLQHYTRLQKKITSNVVKYIKQGGYFLYITCSVFKDENENIVDYILQQSSLTLIKQEILEGYKMQADTMFAALFKN